MSAYVEHKSLLVEIYSFFRNVFLSLTEHLLVYQSFQGHRGAAAEATVVCELHRHGQAGRRRRQRGTAQNHP